MHLDHVHVKEGVSRNVPVFRFPGLSRQKGLGHAVFTRQGGVSQLPYATLNAGLKTGDRPEIVKANLQIIQQVMGAKKLVALNQIHGNRILVIGKNGAGGLSQQDMQADGVITDRPGLSIMIKQADCQAVILFDPVGKVVANIHCGWRGHVQDIIPLAVNEMIKAFGCRAEDLLAAIGPSLGPCCAEFITHEKIFPVAFRGFMVRENFFDLWEISRWQLSNAGVLKENIEVARICTKCRTDLFYSYRAEGVTGRFATVVMLL